MKQQCQSSGTSEPQAHPLGLGKTLRRTDVAHTHPADPGGRVLL